MAKTFSITSVCFDRVPNDSELVCLLGDGDPSRPPPYTPIKFADTFESLTCTPRLVPLNWIMPLLVLFVAGLTCVLWLAVDVSAHWLWLITAIIWLDVPVTLAVFVWINQQLGRKGDHFRVDRSRRTLELCRIGRTINSREIVALTELTRYYKRGSEWVWTQQTGVLVRLPDDRIELLPIVREDQWCSRPPHCADRLADFFGVPVRRIELDKSESKALADR
jgi:hypothetical protein